MMTRNMLNSPSSIDDVRLWNAFSSKESPMTLRTLNIDQALACVFGSDSKLCLPQLVTTTAICIVGGGGGGSSQQVGVCNASETIIVRNAYLIVTLTHWNLKWPFDICQLTWPHVYLDCWWLCCVPADYCASVWLCAHIFVSFCASLDVKTYRALNAPQY